MFPLEHALNQPVFKYWRNIFDLTHLISGNLWKSLHNNVRKWVQFKWSVSVFEFDVVFDSYIFLLKIYDPLICHMWSLIWLHTHCYFTRLNLDKMEPLQFCLSISLGILRNPKQKEFFNSYEGFLMAALTQNYFHQIIFRLVHLALNSNWIYYLHKTLCMYININR